MRLFDKIIPRPAGATTCDLCGGRATCDAPTRMGPWGYLCDRCFDRYGVPGLGFLFADDDEGKDLHALSAA